jgi:hypothetical protein
MTKIENNANKTITVTDTDVNTKFVILGSDCEVRIFDFSDMYATPLIKTRTVTIYNKYNRHLIANVTSASLDPTSTSYNANMDIYFQNLLGFLF